MEIITNFGNWLQEARYNRTDFGSIWQRELDVISFLVLWALVAACILFSYQSYLGEFYYDCSFFIFLAIFCQAGVLFYGEPTLERMEANYAFDSIEKIRFVTEKQFIAEALI